jgi:DNA-binding SARP family transcriptional activator
MQRPTGRPVAHEGSLDERPDTARYHADVARAVLVDRPRLLGPALRAPLAVIHGSSGSGKSVLVDQLVRRVGCATLRCAPSVAADQRMTAVDLVDGLRRAARRVGMADLAASMASGSPADRLEALVDALADAVATDRLALAVVVDDAQLLDDEAVVLVERLATDLPTSCRMVICHRPTARLERLVRIPGALEIDEHDLAFVHDEVALVLRRAGVEPSTGIVDDVLRVTSGWAAAVAVVAHHVREAPSWGPGGPGSGPRLLAGLMSRFVDDDPIAAARLAVPPLLDPTIVEMVAGAGAWARLETDGPPLWPAARWWSMPDAIRDAVVAASTGMGGSSGSLDDDEVRAIAERYAQYGEFDAALDLAATTRRPLVVTAVLAHCSWVDLEAVGAGRLVAWFDAAVAAADRSEPDGWGSAIAFGVVVLHAIEAEHPDLHREFAARVRATAATHPTIDPTIRRAVEAEHLHARSSPASAGVVLDEAERILVETPVAEVITRARLHLVAGRVASMRSSLDDKEVAARHLRAAADLFGTVRERRWQATTLARLGYNVLFHAGRFGEADEVMRDGLALLPAGDRTRGWWLASHAEVLDHLGRRVEAVAAANEAISIGARLRDREVEANGTWTLAWIHGHRADLAGVQTCMRRIEELRPGFLRGYGAIDFYGSMVDHLVACGDEAGASRCLDRLRSHPAAATHPSAVRMAEARWEAVVGEPRAALALLAGLGGEAGAQRQADWVRLVEQAIAHARAGDLLAAERAAVAAFADAASLGVPDLPLRLERSLVERLDILLGGRLHGLVAAAGAAGAEVSTVDGDGFADRPIDVTVLGGFALRRGAVGIDLPDGPQAMLVKSLVVRGPTNVEQAIDELWPDADLELGRSRMRNLLNRIRARCGDLVVRRGSVIELCDGVATDLAAFEAAAVEVANAADHRRVALARRAVSLYAGDLLPEDLYTDWVIDARDRLRRRHVALLDAIAVAAERSGAVDEAVEVLHRIVDADPLDADRATRLVRLLVQQARPGSARVVAERTARALVDLALPVPAALRELVTPPTDR